MVGLALSIQRRSSPLGDHERGLHSSDDDNDDELLHDVFESDVVALEWAMTMFQLTASSAVRHQCGVC